LDAAAALQGLIPKLDLADIARAQWLTPDFVDGAWQPTFPRYVMSGDEFRYWQSKPEKEIADQHAGFSDSVLPVYEAGLVDLVADDEVVTDGVRLVPIPGHIRREGTTFRLMPADP
jgi:hypothetical protein